MLHYEQPDSESPEREFFFDGTRIPDPAPKLTIEQVRKDAFLPRNCHSDTVGTGGALCCAFSRAIGSKG
jgi:hypothetical protein